MLLFGVVISGLLLLAPQTIIELFTNNDAEKTIFIARNFIAHFWPAFLLLGINIVFSSYFTAMQKPIHSAAVAISRSLVLPALFLFVLPLFFGEKGIFMAIPLAELATFILALILFMPNTLQDRADRSNLQKTWREKRAISRKRCIPFRVALVKLELIEVYVIREEILKWRMLNIVFPLVFKTLSTPL